VVHTAAPLMPSVWTEAGHQVVLWCNQLTSALASFLLEAVSAPTGAPHARHMRPYTISVLCINNHVPNLTSPLPPIILYNCRTRPETSQNYLRTVFTVKHSHTWLFGKRAECLTPVLTTAATAANNTSWLL
jgi:hypothetical protein